MTFMHRLERRLGWMALPNITLFLMLGQILVYFMMAIGYVEYIDLALIPALVLQGEVWRLVTFIFLPPIVMHPIFMAFAWYLFYLMGTALEDQWGTFRYNLFLWIGFLATMAAAFLVPGAVATNAFLLGSVFLAFAFLNPNFELMLFLLLPIKIKWLALIMWIVYGFTFLFGGWAERVLVFASVANFVVFFGRDIVHNLKASRRRAAFEAQRPADASEPFHRCHTCGITDKTHPNMQFRYCSLCEGDYAYCEEHIRNHDHVKK
jgi:hypothetical protein